MLDINKYLENQLALAKLKCDTKKNTSFVSQRSKDAAELISRQQEKNANNKSGEDSSNKETSSVVSQKSSVGDESDESEYLPSCDEEDQEINLTPIPTTSRSRTNLRRIIDDGDTNLYNERIKKWNTNINAAISGKNGIVMSSADIQYVLSGNKDLKENHNLQNGLCVPNYIWKQLYKYQRVGVKWLWELHQIQSGGLLGDEMGLGKTVQIIAFLAGLSKTESGSYGGLGPSIILAPATVIYQWVSHFHYWYPHLRIAVLHHSGSHIGNHNKLIRDIHSSHGILLITYAGIVKYAKDLLSRKWHYLILDEGHKIRNPNTQVSKLVKQFETPHRILITGSPMQNSLQELWSLFDFMRPGLLGTQVAYTEHFAVPITQGGYANATEFQEAIALEIAKALKNIITPYMLRRTKAEVQEHINLPKKNEQVLFCALTQEQRDLYIGYLMCGTVRSILDKDNKYGDPVRAKVLVALSTLKKICNHPDLYLYEALEDIEEVNEKTFGHWKRSGKMSVVHSLLKIWQKQGHRALIFSQSRAMLCVLEQYLLNQQFKYLKMDGTVSVCHRQSLIKTFNDSPEYLVFLSTTRVGGLGVNLTGADRVIVFDPDWNPATDNQAKERAWRIGQQRNVTVYRLLSAGTIEEKIYQRQVFKHFLSNKILIDPNQKNVLTTSTLHSLFTYEEPNCNGDTETASLFKHTKVIINEKNKEKDPMASSSESKLEAMRRMAKEISKKITSDVKKQNLKPIEDPREKYKKKRNQLLNPPLIEEPQINTLDDKITNVPFENVLSELDIINMHAKKDYEENLIKEALKTQEGQKEEGEIHSDDEYTEVDCDIQTSFKDLKGSNTNNVNQIGDKNSSISPIKVKKSRKRRHSPVIEQKIENLIAIKKVKKSKQKHDEEKKDDDYVLSKLFAKATVQSALQHDVVIGLAEKEKKHKIKEEAAKRARDAVRAIKFSTK